MLFVESHRELVQKLVHLVQFLHVLGLFLGLLGCSLFLSGGSGFSGFLLGFGLLFGFDGSLLLGLSLGFLLGFNLSFVLGFSGSLLSSSFLGLCLVLSGKLFGSLLFSFTLDRRFGLVKLNDWDSNWLWVGSLFSSLGLLEFKGLFGFHLLSNLKHLKLSLSLSSLELVLSLQSSKISLSGGFLGSSSLGLLNSLSGKELLLHLLGNEFLGSFLLLELLELLSSLLGEYLFLLSLLLSHSNLGFEFLVLLDLDLSCLFFFSKLLEQSFLLLLLLFLEGS